MRKWLFLVSLLVPLSGCVYSPGVAVYNEDDHERTVTVSVTKLGGKEILNVTRTLAPDSGEHDFGSFRAKEGAGYQIQAFSDGQRAEYIQEHFGSGIGGIVIQVRSDLIAISTLDVD